MWQALPLFPCLLFQERQRPQCSPMLWFYCPACWTCCWRSSWPRPPGSRLPLAKAWVTFGWNGRPPPSCPGGPLSHFGHSATSDAIFPSMACSVYSTLFSRVAILASFLSILVSSLPNASLAVSIRSDFITFKMSFNDGSTPSSASVGTADGFLFFFPEFSMPPSLPTPVSSGRAGVSRCARALGAGGSRKSPSRAPPVRLSTHHSARVLGSLCVEALKRFNRSSPLVDGLLPVGLRLSHGLLSKLRNRPGLLPGAWLLVGLCTFPPVRPGWRFTRLYSYIPLASKRISPQSRWV